MIADKHFWVYSVHFQGKQDIHHHFHHVGAVICATYQEATEFAQEEGKTAMKQIIGVGIFDLELKSTTVNRIHENVIQQAAIEILGVDIKPDQDVGSAG